MLLDVLTKICSQLQDRSDMNRRTADIHPDTFVRAESLARVGAYDQAMRDIWEISASYRNKE